MKITSATLKQTGLLLTVLLGAAAFTGCQSSPKSSTAAAAPPAGLASATPAPPKVELPTLRIKAAATENVKDSAGNVWLADRGFDGGETIERPDITITNTTEQFIYRSERYSMTGFHQDLPNGKYTVKLHFCETYDGITDKGQRVFSFNVAGHDFPHFDVFAKAGFQTAYIETVPVDITNGKLTITFTPEVENPQINGIEILPAQ